MSLKSDLYEALMWHALESADFKAIAYEPERDCHNCDSLCAHASGCDKFQRFPRLLHTIPDFITGTKSPTFFHVCYWESKETSHAKFWRTVAELGELKRFVPNSTSVCVVFEASTRGDKYKASGWYHDFLISFRELFDGCIFFDEPTLELDVAEADEVFASGSISTPRIHKAIANGKLKARSLSKLIQCIQKPLRPVGNFPKVRGKLWLGEQTACSSIDFCEFDNQFGIRIRNAILQIVLLSLLFDEKGSIEDFVFLLQGAREQIDQQSFQDFLLKCKHLPIDFREGIFSFLVKDVIEEFDGSSRAEFSEDLEWIFCSLKLNAVPFSIEAFFQSIRDTRSGFLSSDQVAEVIVVLNERASLTRTNESELGASAIWSRFLEVPRSRKYNQVAEMLISSTGLGTYPLVAEINSRCPFLKVTRNDIRQLYSNRISIKARERQRQILLQIAKIAKIAEGNDSSTKYLLRKTGRIVGPQSAINPLGILVNHVVRSCTLERDVSFFDDGIELPTLASDLCNGSQAGLWRVSSYFQKGGEIVPIFFSAMKNAGNCSDKTREFCGHMWMSRWRFEGQSLANAAVRRGVAVLEGAYADDDKRAFHLVGYNVCSVATLESTLVSMGLARIRAIRKTQVVRFATQIADDLAMAAEDAAPPKLKKAKRK